MPYKDPAKRAACKKAFYESNRDQIVLKRREEYPRRCEAHKAYYDDHRETILVVAKVYRRTHIVGIKAKEKTYRESHPVQVKAAIKAWGLCHPEVKRIHSARRRARKRGLPHTLTVGQWLAIKVAYHHRCAYCGTPNKRLTQDHVIPLSKGGGTTSDNIVPACQSCNSKKHAGPPPVIPPVRLLI